MCGCGKNKAGSSRIPRARTNTNVRALRQSAAPTPAELRMLGQQQSMSLKQSRQLDSERRKIEKTRRDMIRKKFK